MKSVKDKIIAGCIIIGIIMTMFPPQKITREIYNSPNAEEIEYRFIGDGGSSYEQTSILYDRLFLQYLILIGAGYAIYLLRSDIKEFFEK